MNVPSLLNSSVWRVGVCLGDEHRADVCVGAGAVLDHHRLFPFFAQMRRYEAEQHVRRAARAERDHNADGLGREIGGLSLSGRWRCRCDTERDNECAQSGQHFLNPPMHGMRKYKKRASRCSLQDADEVVQPAANSAVFASYSMGFISSDCRYPRRSDQSRPHGRSQAAGTQCP